MEQIRLRVAVECSLVHKLLYGSRGVPLPRTALCRRRMYRRLPHPGPRFRPRPVPRVLRLRGQIRIRPRPPQCLRLRALLFLPLQDRHLKTPGPGEREAGVRWMCRQLPHPGIARLRRLPNLSRREAFLLAHRRRLPCVRGQAIRVRLPRSKRCRRRDHARNLPCAPAVW